MPSNKTKSPVIAIEVVFRMIHKLAESKQPPRGRVSQVFSTRKYGPMVQHFDRSASIEFPQGRILVFRSESRTDDNPTPIYELECAPGGFKRITLEHQRTDNRSPDSGRVEGSLIVPLFIPGSGNQRRYFYSFYYSRFPLRWHHIEKFPHVRERTALLGDVFWTDLFLDGDPSNHRCVDEAKIEMARRGGAPTRLGYMMHLVDPLAEAYRRAMDYEKKAAKWTETTNTLSENSEYRLAKRVQNCISARPQLAEEIEDDKLAKYLERTERRSKIECRHMENAAASLLRWCGWAHKRVADNFVPRGVNQGLMRNPSGDTFWFDTNGTGRVYNDPSLPSGEWSPFTATLREQFDTLDAGTFGAIVDYAYKVHESLIVSQTGSAWLDQTYKMYGFTETGESKGKGRLADAGASIFLRGGVREGFDDGTKHEGVADFLRVYAPFIAKQGVEYDKGKEAPDKFTFVRHILRRTHHLMTVYMDKSTSGDFMARYGSGRAAFRRALRAGKATKENMRFISKLENGTRVLKLDPAQEFRSVRGPEVRGRMVGVTGGITSALMWYATYHEAAKLWREGGDAWQVTGLVGSVIWAADGTASAVRVWKMGVMSQGPKILMRAGVVAGILGCAVAIHDLSQSSNLSEAVGNGLKVAGAVAVLASVLLTGGVSLIACAIGIGLGLLGDWIAAYSDDWAMFVRHTKWGGGSPWWPFDTVDWYRHPVSGDKLDLDGLPAKIGDQHRCLDELLYGFKMTLSVLPNEHGHKVVHAVLKFDDQSIPPALGKWSFNVTVERDFTKYKTIRTFGYMTSGNRRIPDGPRDVQRVSENGSGLAAIEHAEIEPGKRLLHHVPVRPFTDGTHKFDKHGGPSVRIHGVFKYDIDGDGKRMISRRVTSTVAV